MPTNFKADQVIFREGEMANRFYLILEGRVILEAESPDQPSVPVDYASTGDVLGWSWLFPPYKARFDARALNAVRALSLDGACLRKKCESDPALGYQLLRRFTEVVVSRLEATRMQLLDLYGND